MSARFFMSAGMLAVLALPLSPTIVQAQDFDDLVRQAAGQNAIPATWVRAVLQAESAGDPHAVSGAGAVGLMQLMPGTWKDVRRALNLGGDPFDPHDNIAAGAAYLRWLHDRYGDAGFLAAYNAGPGRYDDHLATGRPLPAKTVSYVASVARLIDDPSFSVHFSVPFSIAPAHNWTSASLFISGSESTFPSSSQGIFLSRSGQAIFTPATLFAGHVRSAPGMGSTQRVPHLEAAGDGPVGSIVELRRFTDKQGRDRVALAVRSDVTLERQVAAEGATWLDRQAIAREPLSLASTGFGANVKEAVEKRMDHLVEQGLASRDGGGIRYARNLIATLRQRELDTLGRSLAMKSGMPFRRSSEGDPVAGTYRQRFNLASGRFAMIDDGLGFELVPWSPSLEKQRGREVSGIVRSDGGIDWSFARKRGWGL